MSQGLFASWPDVWLLDGARTPFVDYNGALALISPTDLAIKAAREAIARAAHPPLARLVAGVAIGCAPEIMGIGPLAATGLRLTLTLARELQRVGRRFGIASACIGGGQGIALLIENTGI